ncbi:hypothetical protein MAR_021886 [Mya arenaria]|uniref:Uncharacterized protein n=1 Tax=Mya arenaria TaxID=6604 RepID=A0ABY7E929_MYAAR|nr:hypothetical protein MAR_021886 [Mya arenaria]
MEFLDDHGKNGVKTEERCLHRCPTSLLIGNPSLTHLSRIGRCMAEHRPVSIESEVIVGVCYIRKNQGVYDSGCMNERRGDPVTPPHASTAVALTTNLPTRTTANAIRATRDVIVTSNNYH